MNETDSFSNYPKDRNWRIEPEDYDFDDEYGFDEDESCGTTQPNFEWMTIKVIIGAIILIVFASFIVSKIL